MSSAALTGDPATLLLSLPAADCPTCAALWAAEREHLTGRRHTRPADGTGLRSVLHPHCPRHPYAVPGRPRGETPYGPLLGRRVEHDAGLRLWVSDVVLTVPPGTRGHPAVVGGGIADDPDEALTIGWVEALERRCTLRRPRERLRFTGRPVSTLRTPDTAADDPPQWRVAAHRLCDGETVWLPLPHAVVDSQRHDPADADVRTDSTGMAAHPDRDSALFRGARELLERTALHAWWTGPGSHRCTGHSARTLEWLRDSAHVLPGVTVDVWHVRKGSWYVAGCLLLTPRHDGIVRAAFGSGAAPNVEAAVAAASREAYQMHTAPRISLTPAGAARFGPATGHTVVPGDYGARFRRAFPADSSCTPARREHGAAPDLPDGGLLHSVLDSLGAPAAFSDCGDQLTDALGLHVVRVMCPGLPRLTPATRSASGGLRPRFLGA
ncbi:YcaO-like family protein [Streptomyces lavendulocolor]|uniref:YcaO-like family protein n=1 Tax=Streptomyces lavendulocolor TaxID=67316 RepID=A0ABV2W8U5_9ACTN